MNFVALAVGAVGAAVFAARIFFKNKNKNKNKAKTYPEGGFVRLYQFGGPPSAPSDSNSPFCRKVHVFCQLKGIPVEIVNALTAHKRTGKMPWVQICHRDGRVEEVADSEFILGALQEAFPSARDAALPSARDAAVATLAIRTMEESTYWAIVRNRWLDGPKSVANLAKNYFHSGELFARFVIWVSGLRKVAWGQGVARYTGEQVVQRVAREVSAISELLADRKPDRFFFNSATPTTIDAALFAHLSALFWDWDGNAYAHLQDDRIKTYLAFIAKHLQAVEI